MVVTHNTVFQWWFLKCLFFVTEYRYFHLSSQVILLFANSSILVYFILKSCTNSQITVVTEAIFRSSCYHHHQRFWHYCYLLKLLFVGCNGQVLCGTCIIWDQVVAWLALHILWSWRTGYHGSHCSMTWTDPTNIIYICVYKDECQHIYVPRINEQRTALSHFVHFVCG